MKRWPAILLDRDGTLIEEAHYLTRPDQVRLLPGAAQALRRAGRRGFRIALVTNQSAVARGMLTESQLDEVHRELQRQLAAEGARLDGIFTCPHLADGRVEAYRRECDCRKPKPGLLLEAAKALDLDLSRSVMIGDRELDLRAGRAAGCRCILVLTGYGRAEAVSLSGPPPDFVAEDLTAAVRWYLEHLRT